ncbi:UDP-3-O-acylglucosamine N-acyltransferase, partial [Clarias magur]
CRVSKKKSSNNNNRGSTRGTPGPDGLILLLYPNKCIAQRCLSGRCYYSHISTTTGP